MVTSGSKKQDGDDKNVNSRSTNQWVSSINAVYGLNTPLEANMKKNTHSGCICWTLVSECYNNGWKLKWFQALLDNHTST